MVADAVAGVRLDVVAGKLAEPRPAVEEPGQRATTAATASRRTVAGAASASCSAASASAGSGSSTVSGIPCFERLTGWSVTCRECRSAEDPRKPAGTIGVVTDTVALPPVDANAPGDGAEPHAPERVTDAAADGAKPRPPSTRLLLARHAVTAQTGPLLSGRAPGIDLSDHGREQAEALGARLAGLPVAAVYASPIERTMQTAEAVARRHELAVRTLDGVIEADYGEWTGGKLADLAKTDLWKTVQRAPSRAQFPNGESLAEMQARMVAALEDVVGRHTGELVIVVSHADPIKAAIAHYTGVHLDLFQRIMVSPASITAFELTAHGAAMVKCNDTGSLDEPRAAGAGEAVMGEIIELDDVDAPAGAVGEPGKRALHPGAHGERTAHRARREDGIAVDGGGRVPRPDRRRLPGGPDRDARRRRRCASPPCRCSRRGLIGLGFDPERELVLIELRERPADEDDEELAVEASEDDDDEVGYVARIYATGRCVPWPRRRCRCRRPPAVPAVRDADGPHRPSLPAVELTPDEFAESLGAAGAEVVGRMRYSSNATFLSRRRSTATSSLPSTSRAGANGRCGTSRGHAVQPRGGGLRAVRRPRLGRRARHDHARRPARRGRCSGSSSTIPTSTTSRSSRAARTASASSRCSTCSPTTPTVRAGTACTTRRTT